MMYMKVEKKEGWETKKKEKKRESRKIRGSVEFIASMIQIHGKKRIKNRNVNLIEVSLYYQTDRCKNRLKNLYWPGR